MAEVALVLAVAAIAGLVWLWVEVREVRDQVRALRKPELEREALLSEVLGTVGAPTDFDRVPGPPPLPVTDLRGQCREFREKARLRNIGRAAPTLTHRPRPS